MSYEDKINAVRELLSRHNSQVSKESFKVNIDDFFEKLSASGGTTEEALSECKWEDLEVCGLPRLLSRKVAEIFRQQNKVAIEETPVYVKESHAKAMPARKLVELYDPKEPDNNVGKVLAEKSKNQPFIIFGDDGRVNVDASVTLLEELRDGHQPREFYKVGGIPHEIYVIGGRPDKLADVNPLFPQECLRPNGDCSQTGRCWNSVSLEAKVLIFLARTQTNEIHINDIGNAHDIIKMAVMDNGIEELRMRFPKAVVLYRQLKDQGSLPSLRTAMGQAPGSRKNDPFHGSSSHFRS